MVPLAAHLDESGNRDTPILTVAGYVATGEQRKRFAREWVGEIRAEGIDLIHMVDLEGGRPPCFEGWSRSQKDDLFRSLTRILNPKVLFQTWAAVNFKECEEVINEFDKDLIASPYVFCGVLCLLFISNWARAHWKKEQVECFFEEGRPFSGDMFRLWHQVTRTVSLRERYKIAAIRKGSKKQLVPLQAADCLAYEIAKKYNNPSKPVRPYIQWLELLGPKSKGRFFDRREIADFVKMANEDFDRLGNSTYLKKRDRRLSASSATSRLERGAVR